MRPSTMSQLTLDGVSIGDEDIETLCTACGLSLKLIAYLFKSFALAKSVASSGTLLLALSLIHI